MSSNKKLVPKRRFKEYKDADAWEQRKLSEVCNAFEYGLNAAATTYDGKNKYLRITDIDDSSHRFNYDDLTSPDTDINLAYNYRLDEGDILFARTGASVGKTYLYHHFDGLVYFAGFLIRAKIKPEYNAEFIFQNTLTDEYGEFIRIISQRSGQPGVNAQEYGEYTFYAPKEAEQRRIGAYFKSLDNLITLHQRKLSKLRDLKSAMLSEMFPQNGQNVPIRRFSGFTDAWEQRKLGEVGNTYTGLSGKTKEDFGHGDGQFITYMNVFGNSVSSSEMIEPVEIDDRQSKVLSGDVLFTTSSETPEEVGMSSVWLENSENTYLNSFCFGYRPIIPFDPYYLAYMLRSSSMRKKITYLAQGISRYNISKNKMMDITIPVPTMTEQQQLGDYFRSLDNLITLHQRKVEKLENIKKAYLNELFV